MREHEVPTHVQAEDKVLLWFTFPQIVAMTAVGAMAYGAYRYAPIGPSEARMALAVLIGLLGVAMTVGKVGGRRLPQAAADLLRFGLGPRRYAGPPAQLARSEPPAPAVREAGPLTLMARRVRRGLRGLRKKKRSGRERHNGRMPLRARDWLRKRRQHRDQGNGHGHQAAMREPEHPRNWRAVLAASSLAVVVLAVAVVAAPRTALADGHWRDEIDFEVLEPVPGRRIIVEELTVTDGRADVALRAATALDLRVRAYGGPEGRDLRFWGAASLVEGEQTSYFLPLSGETPSLTFSWEDGLGQAGAVAFKDGQLPHPLPSAEGELCDLRVASLVWSPGRIEGTVESDCVSVIEEAVSLQTAAGHASVTETALMEAEITGVTGTVTVTIGATDASVPFVPGGETRFSLSVEEGEAVHTVAIEADIEAGLRIPIPPLVQLTHHPERVEQITKTVHLLRPGDSDADSETATVSCADGSTSSATATAYAHVPSVTIAKDVTVDIQHQEHVRAEVVERSPIAGSRGETLRMATSIASDASFEVLVLPEPTPTPVPAEQTPLTDGELRGLFGILGWGWPW